jgi:hypothetical protein
VRVGPGEQRYTSLFALKPLAIVSQFRVPKMSYKNWINPMDGEVSKFPPEFAIITNRLILLLFALSTQIHPASNSNLEIWEFIFGISIQQVRDKTRVLPVSKRFTGCTLSFGLGE